MSGVLSHHDIKDAINMKKLDSPTSKKTYEDLQNEQLTANILTEVSTDPTINRELAQKISDTFSHFRLKQTLEMEHIDGSIHNLLGLSDIQPPTFTYDEQKIIQAVFQEKLHEFEKHVQKFAKIDGNNSMINEKMLLDERENVKKILMTYTRNLLEYHQILQLMKEQRFTSVPELCANQLQKSEVVDRKNKYQIQLLNRDMDLSIFQETEVSFDAYKLLLENIKKQQERYAMEIEQMKEQKAKYKMVDCKEYQTVLKEYIKYKESIEKIHRMQNLLKKSSK